MQVNAKIILIKDAFVERIRMFAFQINVWIFKLMPEFAKVIAIRMALSTVFVAKLKKLDVDQNRNVKVKAQILVSVLISKYVK